MDILVGRTGFVGSNLLLCHAFDGAFNSSDIAASFGTNPGICVYAGVKAEKFTADKFPDDDFRHVTDALNNIKRINPKKLVLISTSDVIPQQQGDVFENTAYPEDNLTPYGRNRLWLEKEVKGLWRDALIVRLPALFGEGLKKNFVFDLINYFPMMLKKEKFEELTERDKRLKGFYTENESGFFRLAEGVLGGERIKLKAIFKSLGFSALNFTDSRSKFSFYNLRYLWEHIELLLEAKVSLAHMAGEPVSAGEIYKAVYAADFVNEIMKQPFDYGFFKTGYAEIYGGSGGYVIGRERLIAEITEFVKERIGIC